MLIHIKSISLESCEEQVAMVIDNLATASRLTVFPNYCCIVKICDTLLAT